VWCLKMPRTASSGGRTALTAYRCETIPDGWLAKFEVAFPPCDPQALGTEPRPPTAKPDGTPTVLWNAMVHPLIPYGIKGVIWYRGENNVKRG
jgi:sialate O-acetylesterase